MASSWSPDSCRRRPDYSSAFVLFFFCWGGGGCSGLPVLSSSFLSSYVYIFIPYAISTQRKSQNTSEHHMVLKLAGPPINAYFRARSS